MRRFFLCIGASMLVAVSSVNAQETRANSPAADSANKEILTAEEQFDRALLSSDIHTLANLWANGFLYVGTNAELLTKAQRLSLIESRQIVFEAIERDDVKVAAYKDAIVVSGRYTSTLQIRDQGTWGVGGMSHVDSPGRLSGKALFTHVYARIDGRWQIILEHLTYITED